MRDEIRRLDHILEDFLQFARPREFVAKPVEVGVLVNRVLDLLGAQAERRAVRLERDLETVAAVAGDEERLASGARELRPERAGGGRGRRPRARVLSPSASASGRPDGRARWPS